MSDAYEARLVETGGTAYERMAIGVVIGSFVLFALSIGALFEWVAVDGTVSGVSTAIYFGGALLLLGVATGALGAFSRWNGVRTTPDRSPGLSTVGSQATLWTITAAFVAGNTLGLGALGWLVAAFVGLLVAYLTITAREDLGATVPAATFVSFVGVLVLTGVISPTWTWQPAAFDAIVPGQLAIPLLTLVGSILTGQSSATAYAGFGTRGRQNGAFLLISLVVLLTISVLLFLLAFVFERGILVVLENLAVSAGTVLFLLAAVLVLLVRYGHVNPATADGTETLVSFVSLAAASVIGLVGVVLAAAIAMNYTISGYAVTIEPTAVVGALPGLVAGLVFLDALRRSGGSSLPDMKAGHPVIRALHIVLGVMGAIVLVEFLVGTTLGLGGIGIVPIVAIVVGGVSVTTLVATLGARFTGRALPSWIPPLTWTASIAAVTFVVCCLHAIATGDSVGGTVGIAASGAVDWPFVMNPSKGLGIQKGVMPAMVGTIWIVLGAVVFAVPLAVGAAVFLTEYAEDSIFTRAVDIATNGLWSTPSIVFGLFGLAFLVPRFGGTPSIFASQLVLGFMLLPLVLITSREAMKSVPDEYRDASAALGVSKWETIRSVVVPASMPGIITGVILGVGRIAGETAPLLLVLNGPNFPTKSPGILSSFMVRVSLQPPFVHVSNPALLERASALPYQLYAVITAGVGAEETFGWGTALVLLCVVLSFFAMGVASRRYFRRKLHQ
nr:phosphate ABC transporter permease PstA [Natrinema sp. DC36]